MFYQAALANTISAIKVGYIAKQRFVVIPANRLTLSILTRLVDVGAIESFFTYKKGICLYTKITLAYSMGSPAISNIKLLSKSTKRYSIKVAEAQRLVKTQWSILILSTSFGILTLQEAVDMGIGGIVLIAITV